ncbi:hypothetical protein CL656_04765 [bacterium]|nr:hypothetical protein [bacterium]|tara:strand:+ start:5802 stop:8570 length:2769 start_codon:yes stop_codon:yes gene_type:complete
MKILVVGCGGRENILIQKLKTNNTICCIGPWINPDIHKLCKYYLVTQINEYNVLNYCRVHSDIDYVVIGSETLLETNFVNSCKQLNIKCIGPFRSLAQLETSKYYTRLLLKESNYDCYNPKFNMISGENDIINIIDKYDKFVIKLNGLAGGKGVFVQDDHFKTREEGIKIIKQKIKEESILIEEKLEGQEFSLFTLTDGYSSFHFPPVQDYKRAYDNDNGPNTGGMGSIMTDFDFLNEEDIVKCEEINNNIIRIIQQKYNEPYIGILYGSFMMTNSKQIKLIEYNCRFGDSEVFNLLNSLETDLSIIFKHMAEQRLNELRIEIKIHNSIVKYLVPPGYPNCSEKIKINYKPHNNVYAASIQNNILLGSRAIAVYGEGDTLDEAYNNCEELIKKINYDNLYWRKDIGMRKDAYKMAGVDIDKGNKFVSLIKDSVKSTYNENVLGNYGSFGGQFKLNNNVLVASTDGVGTKSILIKKYKNNYYNCGIDIVNHSINDILVQGAKPLFFLDYIASDKLDLNDSTSFVEGCCVACKKANCVLLGGETAEMPTVYNKGHMDMVGTIVGEKVMNIETVQENDIAIGFSSSGPQTNGYTLIRKIMEKNRPSKIILNQLLSSHQSVLDQINLIHSQFTITGMCHITGGGLTENIKRTLPYDLNIPFDNIDYPLWCKWLKENGNLSDDEMKKVFNCGIGFIVFVRPNETLTEFLIKNNLMNHKPLRIGILGSTRGSNINAIYDAIYNNDTSFLYNKAEIVCTLSNKLNGGILQRCQDLGIHNEYVPSKDYNKNDYDEKLIQIFENFNVDIILCIGYMRILTPIFTNKWKHKCFNVHPSLLPLFSGKMNLDVHKSVLEAGHDKTGCTIHEVTDDVDGGPIILQNMCPVYDNDTPEILKKRVQKLEQESLIELLYNYIHLSGKVIYLNKVNKNI